MRAAAIAAAVMAAFLGVMYVRFSGDSFPAPDPTPSPAAAATASTSPLPRPALPAFLNDVELRQLETVAGMGFPEDLSLIVETGCWQCDGPSTGLVRVYTDAAGKIRSENLYSVFDNRLPTAGRLEPGKSIAGIAISPDASEMIVQVCEDDRCGVGGLPPGFSAPLIRSTDGGITWHEYGSATGIVIGLVAPGRALLAHFDEASGRSTFSFFPSGEALPAPEPGSYPEILPGGGIAWRTSENMLLHMDGTPYFEFLEQAGGTQVSVLTLSQEGAPHLLSVTVYGSTAASSYVVELSLSGDPVIAYAGWDFPYRGVPVSSAVLISNATIDAAQLGVPVPTPFAGLLPARVDLAQRTITPIVQPFLDPSFPRGRNIVVAVQQGPFARVVNTDNTCLNIRTEPSTTAPALDCAAEGVLLRNTGDEALTDVVFLRVVTPSGIEGWASADYLER